MTRAVAVARAQALYNEETGDFISTTFLQNAYDDVQREVAMETLCHPTSWTLDLLEGQRLVVLPSRMFAIRRKGVTTPSYHPLSGPVSLASIVAEDASWRTTKGTPDRWYLSEAAVLVSGIIETITATPVAGGSAYAVGDILTLATGGVNGKVKVTAIAGSAASAVELYTDPDTLQQYTGSGYSVGTSVTTKDTGAGSGCTVGIATVTSATNWALGLYPVCDADTSDGITIMGYSVPVDSTGDTYEPPWPQAYHQVMVSGMCLRAATRDTGMEMRNARVIGLFSGQYEREKARLAAAVGGWARRQQIRGGEAEQGTGEGYDAIRLTMTVT
jgi:hypothetical protein